MKANEKAVFRIGANDPVNVEIKSCGGLLYFKPESDLPSWRSINSNYDLLARKLENLHASKDIIYNKNRQNNKKIHDLEIFFTALEGVQSIIDNGSFDDLEDFIDSLIYAKEKEKKSSTTSLTTAQRNIGNALEKQRLPINPFCHKCEYH